MQSIPKNIRKGPGALVPEPWGFGIFKERSRGEGPQIQHGLLVIPGSGNFRYSIYSLSGRLLKAGSGNGTAAIGGNLSAALIC
jgi:hypothetical protein